MKFKTFERLIQSLRTQLATDSVKSASLEEAFGPESTIYFETKMIDEIFDIILEDFGVKDEGIFEVVWDAMVGDAETFTHKEKTYDASLKNIWLLLKGKLTDSDIAVNDSPSKNYALLTEIKENVYGIIQQIFASDLENDKTIAIKMNIRALLKVYVRDGRINDFKVESLGDNIFAVSIQIYEGTDAYCLEIKI